MRVNPNATPGYFASYAGEIEKFIHVGKVDNLGYSLMRFSNDYHGKKCSATRKTGQPLQKERDDNFHVDHLLILDGQFTMRPVRGSLSCLYAGERSDGSGNARAICNRVYDRVRLPGVANCIALGDTALQAAPGGPRSVALAGPLVIGRLRSGIYPA